MSDGSPPKPQALQLLGGSQHPTTAKKAHPTFHFVAGLASGISSAVLLQPADLLKTRVQQSRAHTLSQTLRSILSGPNPTTSLWRGTVPSALRTGFGSALYFSSLSSLRQVVANANAAGGVGAVVSGGGINNDNESAPNASAATTTTTTPSGRSSTVLPKLSSAQNLLTGATARVAAGFVLMPMTVIKVRYESSYYAYKSMGGATTSILKSEGLRGFFTGFGATAIRDAPYAGLYVVFYEASKTWLNNYFPARSLSRSADQQQTTTTTGGLWLNGTSINALSGVVAASAATAITNPFDAVKTRLQLMPAKYGNMVRATALMLQEDGLRAFFDGLGLRMGRKAISSALAWTVYEELIGRAERRFVREHEDGKKTAPL